MEWKVGDTVFYCSRTGSQKGEIEDFYTGEIPAGFWSPTMVHGWAKIKGTDVVIDPEYLFASREEAEASFDGTSFV